MRKLKICIVAALAGAALIYAIVIFLLWAFQKELIYHPGEDPGPAPEGWDDLEVITSDRLKLKAWLKRGDKGAGFGVLYLHGNAGNRESFMEDASLFYEYDVPILMLDWRGYGGSRGEPSEKGLFLDAEAGLEALKKETGLDDGKIVVCARSLGTGVAIRLGARHRLKALVLISPYPSIARVGQLLYPYAPVGLLCRERFDVRKEAERVECPVLSIVGTADRLIPMELSLEICGRFRNCRILKIEGADHNDIVFELGKEAVTEALKEFL